MRWLLAAGALAGCTDGASCEDVGQAVAVRTWECTGDSELGFARAKRLRNDLACASGEDHDAIVAGPTCLAEIDALSCEEVDAIGDDPAGWLVAAPGCADAFGPAPAAPATGTVR